MVDQILFDKLAYIDRLTRAGISDEQACAHAEAMDEALRESVATLRAVVKADIEQPRDKSGYPTDHIRLALRNMTIRMVIGAIALFGALAVIKFFGHLPLR